MLSITTSAVTAAKRFITNPVTAQPRQVEGIFRKIFSESIHANSTNTSVKAVRAPIPNHWEGRYRRHCGHCRWLPWYPVPYPVPDRTGYGSLDRVDLPADEHSVADSGRRIPLDLVSVLHRRCGVDDRSWCHQRCRIRNCKEELMKTLTVPASREVIRLLGKRVRVRIAEFDGYAVVDDVQGDDLGGTATLTLCESDE